jgi:hypothetical protein
VNQARPGTQDVTLFSAAWRLARFVRSGALNEGAVAAALTAAAADWTVSNYDPQRGPWTPGQIARRIRRGLEHGRTSNRMGAGHAG